MLVHYCHPVSLDPTHHCHGIRPLGSQHKTVAQTPALCPGTLLLLGQFLRRVLHTTDAGTDLVPICARPHPLTGPHTTAVGQSIFLTRVKLSRVTQAIRLVAEGPTRKGVTGTPSLLQALHHIGAVAFSSCAGGNGSTVLVSVISDT